MKSILYIGDIDTARSLQRESKSLKVEIQPFHAVGSSKKEILSVIKAEERHLFGLILNIDEIGNTTEEITDTIKEILVKTDIRLCLLCAGHTIAEPFIRSTIEMGVQYYMMGANSAVNAKVIRNMLQNKANVSALFDNQPSVVKEEKPVTVIKTKVITVGGCVSRIGTTTLCIQLIKYLQSIGKKVCYIDRSGTFFMNDFLLIYENEGTIDDEHSLFRLDGIDFYYSLHDESRDYAREQGYDYLVCDVGVVNHDEELLSLFLDSEIHILCAGSKSNEFRSVYNLLDVLNDKGVHYAFYSVPKAQKPSIADTCKAHNQKYYFTPYIDDEFTLQENCRRMFNKMFNINDKESQK